MSYDKEYIPYDILTRFTAYAVSLRALFPKLNLDVLRHKSKMDLDLLTMVIAKNFDDLTTPEQTEKFFETVVYSKDNLLRYFRSKLEHTLRRAVRLIVTGIALRRKKPILIGIPSNMG